LREERWFVFLFSILLLLNVGCGKESSGGEGISNKEISNEGISKVEKCPVWYKDADGDGYTDGTTKVSCTKPSDEYVSSATAGDCNDNDPNINPGKTEICDGKDNNCNNQIDEGVLLLVFYKDVDGDGYTDGTTQIGCTAPAGYVLSAKPGDCNDNNPNINPEKAEICDGEDNNCNNQIDEGVLLVFYKDSDKDGYTDGTTKVSCSKPSDEYVSSATAGDCDDADSSKNPGKTEICDNKDNNCNGQIDEGNVCTFAKTIGGSFSDDYAYSIIQSSDGGYVVAGESGGDIHVVKLDSLGNVIWSKTIGGSNNDRATSIIQSSDGRYVVAGWTNSFGAGSYDFYVVKMDANGNVCFSRNTTYSVLSNVGNVSSLSPVVISQSPTVNSVFPIVVSYGVSVKDVCALASAPHLNMCSESQDCGFSSSIATNGENVKSYGCSAGGIFSRFLIPASMLIIYVQLRRKKKKKKG
jgi:hypothetical protein